MSSSDEPSLTFTLKSSGVFRQPTLFIALSERKSGNLPVEFAQMGGRSSEGLSLSEDATLNGSRCMCVLWGSKWSLSPFNTLGEISLNPEPELPLTEPLLSNAKSGKGTSVGIFLLSVLDESPEKWSCTKSGKSLARSNLDRILAFAADLGLAPLVLGFVCRNFLKLKGFSSVCFFVFRPSTK